MECSPSFIHCADVVILSTLYIPQVGQKELTKVLPKDKPAQSGQSGSSNMGSGEAKFHSIDPTAG